MGTMPTNTNSKRLLILAGKLGYQARSFAEAARSLGVEVIFATDRCHQLDDPWQDGAIALHFQNAEEAATRVVAEAASRPIHGILALGDRPTATAARVARQLRLPYNSVHGVEACRNKLSQREVLRDAGLPVPEFFSFELNEDLHDVLPRVSFPCVLKPLTLAASQGVIRANNSEEFTAAAKRIAALLASAEIQATRERALDRVLVESYIPGKEVAVEALLTNNRLRVLAIFDKPDAMEGPFFEESIYVTPSRLPAEAQRAITDCLKRTLHALDLTHGPVHAEFRINERGPWVLEAAPRPIGGLCAKALRFGSRLISLEELLVCHALELPWGNLDREADASGVMMIPVPRSGILERVEGLEAARATPHVREIEITARVHDYIAAWPEGSTYLGFIFANGALPQQVETALRAAHARLHFGITPRLPVEHPVTKAIPG